MLVHYANGRFREVPSDPFSIGAFLFATEGIFAGGAVTIFGVSASTFLIGTAIIGAGVALSFTNKPRGFSGAPAYSINTPESRGNVQQSAPIQQRIYGRVRTGGALFFIDDSKPPFLDIGLMLSDRLISAVRGVHIGGNDIQISNFAFNQVLDPVALDGQYYWSGASSRLKMCFRNGDPNQTLDALLHADYPNLASTFRQQGIATATFRFQFGADANDFERMWGQGVSIPSPFMDIDGSPVYDPRDPAQRYPADWRDAADVAAARATWKFSRTAALIQADWFGDPQGVNQPPDQIDWDKIAAAADFDEEQVDNGDGTSRQRHTIDGVVKFDQAPRAVLEAMLTANRGFAVRSRGRGWVSSSQPRDPVLTIDDDMLVGGFDFQDDRATADRVNTVTSRFSSADRDYQDVDGPALARTDLVASDGVILAKSVRLPFTSNANAVQYLANQYIDESNLPRSLTCNVKLRALGDGVEEGEAVRVESRIFKRLNGIYAVQSIGFADDFSSMVLSLREYDASIALKAYPLQPFTLPALNVS